MVDVTSVNVNVIVDVTIRSVACYGFCRFHQCKMPGNKVNNQTLIPSTDVIQLTLTLKMTTAQVVETSVTVNNSPIQDNVHPADDTQPTYEMTPGFKPFTIYFLLLTSTKCLDSLESENPLF